VPKIYSINDPARPLFASTVPLNGLVAAEIPYATTSAPGIVTLAIASTGVTAGTVVQASDTRLGTVKAEHNTGGSVGAGNIINFVDGSNVTMTVTEVGGVITVTINSTTSGGFPGYGSSVNADTAGGSAGSSTLVSRTDHAHTLSTEYAESVQYTLTNVSHTFTVPNPRCAVGVSADGSGNFSIGIATAVGQTNAPFLNTNFLEAGTTSAAFSTFTSGSQDLTGGSTGTWGAFVLGQVGV
jgi:hypothetical protein